MPNWPAGLPQFMGPDTSIQDDESRLIQSMDAGPASIRNRFTAITQTIKTRIILTGDELATFLTFFRDTINHGTDSFTWTHPIDGTSKDMRFKAKPEWRCIRPSSSVTDRLWTADFEIEVLPE